jgi:hypothetical protein
MAAAKAMDEIHPSLSNSFNDQNTYTLGQIGAHNTVIAYMPLSVYGTTSVVTVATSIPPLSFAHNFPVIRPGGKKSRRSSPYLGVTPPIRWR